MEPLSALSLAAAVVQFVQFTSGLINGTQTIHRSTVGLSEKSQAIHDIYDKLSIFSLQLQNPGAATEDASLVELATNCQRDCDKLVDLVGKLKANNGKKRKWWTSFQKAILELWQHDDMEELKERIAGYQGAMVLTLCTTSR